MAKSFCGAAATLKIADRAVTEVGTGDGGDDWWLFGTFPDENWMMIWACYPLTWQR